MISSKQSLPSIKDALASTLRPRYGILPSLTFVLILSIGTAWSYDGRHNIYSDINVSRETLQHNDKNDPSSILAGQCLPLLNTHDTPLSTAKNGNQRTVGQVAALGIILGARFALEPKNNAAGLHTKKAISKQQKGTTNGAGKRTAHAIANYRQCLKQIALNRTANRNDV